MARRDGTEGEFVEALARGLDVLTCFQPGRPAMTLAEVATATGLARATARRLLLTLEHLGYVRGRDGWFSLTPAVLRLGLVYTGALGLWDVARPHLEDLVRRTGESSSLAQLDGADMVYVGRVAVPRILSLAVRVGTVLPAAATSMGKVLLAALPPDELSEVLARPSRSTVVPRHAPTGPALDAALAEVRARGYAVSDEELTLGVRSVAAPVRDGAGRVVAAVNVTVHAAETPLATLLEEHLPHLLRTVAAVSADWALRDAVPAVTVQA